jgi:MoaA/NifB/PqqE/SkfB family radical SAM enzyme
MALRLVNHPVLANYYVTYRCNARCGFCDIWEKPSPYVTLAQAEANLRDLKRLGVQVIDFTGGEPLLHQQLPELLHLAKTLGFITTVTTNTLLYPKLAEALAGRVDMLHFSLDHPDAERHDASRGVKCFEHFMRSLDIARTLGERPDVLYTVTNENADAIEQVVREITDPRKLTLILNPLFAYGEGDAAVGGSLDPVHFDSLRHWAREPGVYVNEAFLALREQGGNDTQAPVCAAGSSTIVISPEDELILPCYHLNANAIPLEGRLYEVWTSPQTQALIRHEGRLPQCAGCAINCYMQPSFATRVNSYFWRALPSTLSYAWQRWGLNMRPAPYRMAPPAPRIASRQREIAPESLLVTA